MRCAPNGLSDGVHGWNSLPDNDAGAGRAPAAAKDRALGYSGRPDLKITYHVYGRDGAMGSRERIRNSIPHELGLVIDVMADDQELAHGACHLISGTLLHAHYPGIINTSETSRSCTRLPSSMPGRSPTSLGLPSDEGSLTDRTLPGCLRGPVR